jgi:hypothetical protein
MKNIAKEILHKNLIRFELTITQLGIKGRIEFEEAMLKAMEEHSNFCVKELKQKIKKL